ncbi:MAG: efflux RND transporter periplasmic adaptor subunit [Candidatus Omnitrophica bacterium]|nr:efflux RND transporter periplasmic adaptor subunit [Candidatus Omnitrophota bacterium]
MKLMLSCVKILVIISGTLFLSGYDSNVYAASEGKAANGHGEKESSSGASFKAGKGITLKDETRKIIGLEIADVTEEPLSQVVQLNVQIFEDPHRFSDLEMDHTGCQFHGSGFVPPEKAVLVKPKQQVKFKTSGGETLDGFVAAVQEPLAHGEIEVIVGVTTAGSHLKDGEFVKAVISLPRDEIVTVIPSSALLRTIQGAYVYAVNGDAYYRTAVIVGGVANGKTEIRDGLYSGDQVVTKPVETLWLIELRATKGGGHCH